MLVRASIDLEAKELAERIDAAVRENGGVKAVSAGSETPPRTLSKYMAGDATPSAIALGRIARATSRSVDWFVHGSEEASRPAQSGGEQSDQTDEERIKLLDVVAGAGGGIDNDDSETERYFPFSRSRLQRLGIRPDKVRAHEVRGDSMEPTIMDRAIVLIDITMRDLVDGRIYSIQAPDGVRVKRIQRRFDNTILLISDNDERYPPERLTREEAAQVQVLGRVFWSEKLL